MDPNPSAVDCRREHRHRRGVTFASFVGTRRRSCGSGMVVGRVNLA